MQTEQFLGHSIFNLRNFLICSPMFSFCFHILYVFCFHYTILIKKNLSVPGQTVFEIFKVENLPLDGVFWSRVTAFLFNVAFP